MYPLSTPDTGHKLTELYIRRNQLSDFGELDHLTSLPNLTVSENIHCVHQGLIEPP